MVVFRWVTFGKSPTHKKIYINKYITHTNNNSAFIKIFMVEQSLTQKIGLSVQRKRLLNTRFIFAIYLYAKKTIDF